MPLSQIAHRIKPEAPAVAETTPRRTPQQKEAHVASSFEEALESVATAAPPTAQQEAAPFPMTPPVASFPPALALNTDTETTSEVGTPEVGNDSEKGDVAPLASMPADAAPAPQTQHLAAQAPPLQPPQASVNTTDRSAEPLAQAPASIGEASMTSTGATTTANRDLGEDRQALAIEPQARETVRSADPAQALVAALKPETPAAPPVPIQPLALAPAPGVATVFDAQLPAARPQAPIPVNDVAVAIAARALDGEQRFEIRLDPASLGRIEVTLEVGKDGGIRTHMVVERAETLHLLKNDAQKLDQAFTSAGLSSDPGSTAFSLRSDSGNQRNPYRQDQPQQTAMRSESEPEPQIAPAYASLRIAASALDLTL